MKLITAFEKKKWERFTIQNELESDNSFEKNTTKLTMQFERIVKLIGNIIQKEKREIHSITWKE